MNRSKVYVSFPKAGLGNMLFTWSRAFVFAKLNSFEMFTSGWTRIHPGAWVRLERKKRLYAGYFKKESVIKKLSLAYFILTHEKVYEPSVKVLESEENHTGKVFIFNKIFTDYDFFKDLRPHKRLVYSGLLDMLNPVLKQQYDKLPKPEIGVHIRRGDFKLGSTLTPLSFFIEVVTAIRKSVGEQLNVTIFSDGNEKELKQIMELPYVSLAKPNPDILDILLLADSRFLVLSIGSSFSYWAAFLAKGTIIKSSVEWHVPFRSDIDPDFEHEITWGKNNYTFSI